MSNSKKKHKFLSDISSPNGRLRYGFSALLNQPGHHSTASIAGSSTAYAHHTTKLRCWHDIDVKITDCSRAIELCFDARGQDSIENSRHKAKMIISSMAFVLEFLDQAEKDSIAQEKAMAKRNKKKKKKKSKK